MLIRMCVSCCLLSALMVLAGSLRPAAAQQEKPPLDRPADEDFRGGNDLRGPWEGPLPKDGFRKPPRLGPEGLGPGGLPVAKPWSSEGRPQGPPEGRPPGAPSNVPPGFMVPGAGGLPGPPKMPPGTPGYDPEMYQLDQADFELSRKAMEAVLRYRNANAEDRAQLKKELAELVNRHFDVRQQRRELQLKRLEEELQRLRESIEARSKAREQIVQKRIAELLGDTDDLSF